MASVISTAGFRAPNRTAEALDTILKGLQIAEKGYGLVTASEDKEVLRKQAEIEADRKERQLAVQEQAGQRDAQNQQRQLSGQLTPQELIELRNKGVDIQPLPSGPLSTGQFELRSTTGERFAASPAIKPPELEKIETVDAQGNPVTMFVAKSGIQGGETFLKPPKSTGLSESAKLVQGERDLRRTERKEEDLRERGTPFGVARTKIDAKILKDGQIEKESFDRQLQKMIALRKEYGFEVLNREAVDSGKQLSKDLLLTYKNMAKLGVLSKSDEDIVNAIIPQDPLALGFSGTGEDPILARLEQLSEKVNTDFKSGVQIRLEPGEPNPFPESVASEPGQEGQGGEKKPPPMGEPPGKAIKQDGVWYQWDGFDYVEVGNAAL